MEQKEMEARLVALEAKYAEKRCDIDNLIRFVQNEMTFEETNYNNAILKHKQSLRKYESEKQTIHVNYQKEKAAIYEEFAQEGHERVNSAEDGTNQR